MSETTPDYPAEFHARLLFYAEADLRAAESLLQEAGPYWHKPCFEAREAAEKALKAFLEASGKQAPETHGLNMLLRECMAVDKNFGAFRHHGQVLAPYQAEARYPEVDRDYDFTAEEAAEAVRLARELFNFVCERLEQRKQAGLLG